MSEERILEEIETIKSQLEKLKADLEEEIASSQADRVLIHRKTRQLTGFLESLFYGLLGFGVFLVVILTGLKIELGWLSFQIPPNLLESSVFVGFATAGVKYFQSRMPQQSHQQDSQKQG